ncbi:MAG: chemotaxis protein [Oscillospiraceae bacterium]|nr:chemotaxis protein [Oscillospiraceae bacterium]
MAQDAKQDILTESGTNEVEIIEFNVGGNIYGINVAKVKTVSNFSPVTPVPNTHPSIKGIIKPRDEVITVVDLPRYLNVPPSENEAGDYFIITYFNKVHIAFQVHKVVRIHRISWKSLEKADSTLAGDDQEGLIIGVVKIENRLVIILDFEKIIYDIAPKTGINLGDIDLLGTRQRTSKPILIAEDSVLLSKMLYHSLSKAGYDNIYFANDGQEAWEYLNDLAARHPGEPVESYMNCVITDIEMPRMDGHRFTKLIREDKVFGRLPVIIFSSLINLDMKRKGEALGATAQITKPEINNLVGLIDEHIL